MDLVRPSIVLFGDSITQHSFAKNGWAAALANDYSVSMDIFNRGFSGFFILFYFIFFLIINVLCFNFKFLFLNIYLTKNKKGYNTRWANLIVKHCINSEIFRQVEVVTIFFGKFKIFKSIIV